MPRYYFNLKKREGTLLDPDGTDLPDEAAARKHALQVMRELMHNAHVRTRAWRISRQNCARQLKWSAADKPRSRIPSSTCAQQCCSSEALWRAPMAGRMSQRRTA